MFAGRDTNIRMAADPRLAHSAPQVDAAPNPPPPPPPSDAMLAAQNQTIGGLDDAVEDHRNGVDKDTNADNFRLRFCTVCASNQNR